MTLGLISSSPLTAVSASLTSQDVSVREEGGMYLVRARFDVPQTADLARSVLTDYEQIPRFMPDVKTSVVVERTASRLLVEQEAVSKFGLFSRTVHLRLEVTEDGNTIRFIDRCGKSFKHYGGSWTLLPAGSRTTLTYELTAQPDFGVPEFLIKRLLKRDAGEMIARMRGEIAARGRQATDSTPIDTDYAGATASIYLPAVTGVTAPLSRSYRAPTILSSPFAAIPASAGLRLEIAISTSRTFSTTARSSRSVLAGSALARPAAGAMTSRTLSMLPPARPPFSAASTAPQYS